MLRLCDVAVRVRCACWNKNKFNQSEPFQFLKISRKSRGSCNSKKKTDQSFPIREKEKDPKVTAQWLTRHSSSCQISKKQLELFRLSCYINNKKISFYPLQNPLTAEYIKSAVLRKRIQQTEAAWGKVQTVLAASKESKRRCNPFLAPYVERAGRGSQ